MLNPLQFLLLLAITAAFLGFYLLLCGLWSIWLALGRTPLAIRVPVFLLGSLLLALVPSLLGDGGGGGPAVMFQFFGFLTFAVFFAAVMEPKYYIVSGFFFFIALCYALVHFTGTVNSQWLTTTTLGLCFLATIISSSRLFGIRLICFTADAVSREIEAVSGRNVDEWITILDKENAQSWNYARIIIFLRDYGFDYRWQKAIVIAYEKSLGRRSVEHTFDGKTTQIDHGIGWTLREWFSELGRNRFTIVQMMLWSVAAATFFGFFRLIGRFELTTADVAMGAPAIVVMALVTLAVLHGCLGVRNRIPRTMLLVSIALPCFAVPLALGFFPGIAPAYATMVGAMLGYAVWLAGALVLVRQRGYRLVRVLTVSQPAAEASVPQS